MSTFFSLFVLLSIFSSTQSEYRNRGFQEVVSPNIYSNRLWETSGHFPKYKENMFLFEVEEQEYALKPMNCPGHCLMFGSYSLDPKKQFANLLAYPPLQAIVRDLTESCQSVLPTSVCCTGTS